MYIGFIGKAEGKGSIRKPRIGDNIEKGFKQIGCEGVDWIHLLSIRISREPF
jgi:hypothetical protein